LDRDNNGQTQTVSTGQEIDVLLQTIGPGNYGDPEISSTAVEYVGVVYPSAQNPGGPTQQFRFKAVTLGSAVIRIPHTTTYPPFVVTIDVR
jgi:hypothetical protein